MAVPLPHWHWGPIFQEGRAHQNTSGLLARALCRTTVSVSLSTMPLQHVGHEEEVELNHSSALESRSKPSLPPPVSQISPPLGATHQWGTAFSFLNLLPLSAPAASVLQFTVGNVHTPPWPERTTTHSPDLMQSYIATVTALFFLLLKSPKHQQVS